MKHVLRTLSLALLVASTTVSFAQEEPDSYTAGSVYRVTMVRTEANSQQKYLEQLAQVWVPMMEAAKKEGLIKSYTILTGAFSNESDYNVMMLTEFENMAALDENPEREAKWKAVRDRVRNAKGGKAAVDAVQESYHGMRTMVGNKLMRQQLIKP